MFYATRAEPLPAAVRPDDERLDDHGQRPQVPSSPPVQYAAKPFWTTDDAWRSTMLPYQREGSTGRLANPNADHVVPTGYGGYVAVRGAGIGRPQTLASVPVYQYGPNRQLVRAGRAATGNPAQWTTTAAPSNGLVAERANPVRWPTT